MVVRTSIGLPYKYNSLHCGVISLIGMNVSGAGHFLFYLYVHLANVYTRPAKEDVGG